MSALLSTFTLAIFLTFSAYSQNSMVGDGFGGRHWYQPTNFSVGSYTGYFLCNDDCTAECNQLFGWGSNRWNNLGLGDLYEYPGSNDPVSIVGMSNTRFVRSGYLTGAIKNDGAGWVWGKNWPDPFGLPIPPTHVIDDVKFVDAGSNNICFVKEDGTVWFTGFGLYQVPLTNAPIQMPSVNNAVRVAVNNSSACMILADSTVVTLGLGSCLGQGSSSASAQVPTPINGIPKIIDIQSSAHGVIALTAEGDVYSWGRFVLTTGGQLVDFPTPMQVPGLSNIVSISTRDDGYHYLALDSLKNCYAWGSNFYGAFGLPISQSNYIYPSPVLVATDVIDILAGEHFSYLVKSDRSLWGAGISAPLKDQGLWLNYEQASTATTIDSFVMLLGGEEVYSCEFLHVPRLEIPNVFTPNGDHVNDFFIVDASLNIVEMDFYILNRWGEVLYHENGVNPSWSGLAQNGTECNEGVYFYKVQYRTENSDFYHQKGHFTLLR